MALPAQGFPPPPLHPLALEDVGGPALPAAAHGLVLAAHVALRGWRGAGRAGPGDARASGLRKHRAGLAAAPEIGVRPVPLRESERERVREREMNVYDILNIRSCS